MKALVTAFIRIFPLAALALIALPIQAADYPAPKEADWLAREFRFHSGETLPEVRLHTRGHGTTGNAALWRQHLAELLQRAPRNGK
jgi:hypothetical protein